MAHLLQFESEAKRARLPGGHPRTFARVCTPLVMALSLAACISHPTPKTAGSGAAPGATRSHAPRTVVSLTFHDGTVSEYTYARPILRSHKMNATFYITSGWIDRRDTCCVSWSQARELYNDGNEIGGMGTDHKDLTQVYSRDWRRDYNYKKQQVCGQRRRLAQLGLDARSFAYSEAAYKYSFPDRSTVEDLVKACGYLSGRAMGGLGPNEANYAETLPPRDPYAVRTPDNWSSSALTLADLQATVKAAADHVGGWVPLAFNDVCHRGAAGYARCMSSSRTVEDSTLSAFLGWLQRAGQANGAPAGTAVQTVRQVMGAPPQPPLPPPPPTVVSLTFDDGSSGQYLVRGLLRNHNLHATFFVNTGTIDKVGAMTWAQLAGLARDGNEIGGHTRDHVNLRDSKLTPDQKRREVCDDRQRLVGQGFDPVSFAYPYGAYNRAAETIVRLCGYQSARAAGSNLPNGQNEAETIPPHDPYATATWARNSESGKGLRGPLNLSYLTNAVTAAATRSGGWVQLVFHQVCSPSDPNYSRCMAHFFGSIDTTTMNSFLDWLQSRAPSGTAVKTVRQVMGAGVVHHDGRQSQAGSR